MALRPFDEPLVPLQAEHYGGPLDMRPYPGSLINYPGAQIQFPAERIVRWNGEYHRYFLIAVDDKLVYKYDRRLDR
jgi:hypothetical protein